MNKRVKACVKEYETNGLYLTIYARSVDFEEEFPIIRRDMMHTYYTIAIYPMKVCNHIKCFSHRYTIIRVKDLIDCSEDFKSICDAT